MSVTVAISTYHRHVEMLPTAIRSALKADEVIVIDNGYTCYDIATAFGVGYVGREPTTSVVDSRNIAIDKANCDYLIHLDADDWLVDIPKPEGDWYYGDLYIGDITGAIVSAWDYGQMPRNLADAREFAWHHLSLPTPMKAAFRVEWVREHGLYWKTWPNTNYSEDCRTCFDYLAANPNIVYGKPFYAYRLHESQGRLNAPEREQFTADLIAYLKGEE